VINPEKNFTYTQLHKLYIDKKITYKKVLTKSRVRHHNTEEAIAKDNRLFRTLKHEIQQAIYHHEEIVMVDECVFSQRSCKPHAWSNVG